MTEESHLYLLRFHGQPFFKIGKADDVQVRAATLRKVWGAIDYANSFAIALPTRDVLLAERAVHRLLGAHRTDHLAGDGYSELFRVEAANLALDHLRAFAPRGELLPIKERLVRCGVREAEIDRHADLVRERLQKIFRALRRLLSSGHEFSCEWSPTARWIEVVLARRATPRENAAFAARVQDLFEFHLSDSISKTKTNLAPSASGDDSHIKLLIAPREDWWAIELVSPALFSTVLEQLHAATTRATSRCVIRERRVQA
jgi:hypothetical protein